MSSPVRRNSLPGATTTHAEAKSYYYKHQIGELLEQIATDLAINQPEEPRKHIFNLMARMLDLPEIVASSSTEKSCSLRIFAECHTGSGHSVRQFFRSAPLGQNSESLLRTWHAEGSDVMGGMINQALGGGAEMGHSGSQAKTSVLEERDARDSRHLAGPPTFPATAASGPPPGPVQASAADPRVHSLEQEIASLTQKLNQLQHDRAQAVLGQMQAESALKGHGKKRHHRASSSEPHPNQPFVRTPSSQEEIQELRPELCSLRIIAVSDLGDVADMTHVHSAIKAHMRPGAITVMAGNFLTLSPLSALDMGAGMIDAMNHVGDVGIHYTCLGCHESDVPDDELAARLHEFKGAVISSNMTALPVEPRPVEYRLIDIVAAGQRRRVGLVGLVSTDPALYSCQQSSPFGGALATAEPPAQALARLRNLLMESHGCDLVVPVCFLPEDSGEDFALVQSLVDGAGPAGAALPLLLAGGERSPKLEQVP